MKSKMKLIGFVGSIVLVLGIFFPAVSADPPIVDTVSVDISLLSAGENETEDNSTTQPSKPPINFTLCGSDFDEWLYIAEMPEPPEKDPIIINPYDWIPFQGIYDYFFGEYYYYNY